ncbi:WD40 repeat domain-containing serine/threonine protein kinase [Anatilimnocola floriformis]|uniref:WD40 repeat domain-containing serine/threonine protein kinase n=1 Tax=Anatilimnocola floriformis TaxID=2948575 RepID=UPI0020C39841|nr:WD40 repeat domain-containing serine/threonine protein kinase [Anatilimnocola floriformis]
MDDSANPNRESAARGDAPPPSAPEPSRDAEIADESLLADPKFADCLARLEARWPAPKVKAPLLTLQRLGRYEIRRELGRGRFGVVFLAWDPTLKRQVALKVPQFDAAIDPELRERFRGEALSVSQLQHPGIVALYDVGQHAGVDYIAMAFVEGMTLGDRLQEGPLPPNEAAQLIVQLARAVHHAHEHDVIHRDLKPNNVLLDKAGQPHVTDFGLARRLSDSTMRATHTGQVLGTPAYMSPEQATGQSEIGPTSDVYSLGVILYETITGRPPFQAATFAEAVEFILNRDPLPPSKLNPKLPRELDAITFKSLEKRPPNRYASAQELADDLQCFLEGKPIRARTQGFAQKAVRWTWKHPSQALLLVAMLVLVGVLLMTTAVYNRWQHADALAAERQTSAETQRYFATVNQARNVITRRQPGWSEQGLKELQQAAAIARPINDRSELRQLVADCLTGFDLQKEESVVAGMVIGRLANSADGSLLAVGELKGNTSFRVVVYDTKTRKPAQSFTILNSAVLRALRGEGKWQDGVREFAFSSDNRYLAVGLRFGLVYCFDLQNPQELPRQLTVSKERELDRMAFSADGQSLFAHTRDEEFIHWKDWRNDAKYESPLNFKPRSFAVANFSNDLFVSGFSAADFRMMSQSLARRPYISPFAIMPRGADGRLETDGSGSLLAARTDFGLQVYDTLGGGHVRRLQDDTVGDESPGHDLKFSRDGRLLTTFHDRGVARFFDVSQGRQVLRLDLPRNDLQDFSVDPHKRWLVTANLDQLDFWSLRQQRIYQQLVSPAEEVDAVSFSPDAKMLACVTTRGTNASPRCNTLYLFQNETGELVAERRSGVEHMNWSREEARVAWSQSGEQIYVGTLFGTHLYGQKNGTWINSGIISINGPAADVRFEVQPVSEGEEAKAIVNELDNPLAPARKILQVTPQGQKLKLKCRVNPAIKLSKQLPMVVISLRIDAEQTWNAPLLVKPIMPKSETQRAPPWTWRQGKDFQSWCVHLPYETTEVGEFELQFEPQAGLRSFEIERIDLSVLNPSPEKKTNLQFMTQLSTGGADQRIWAVFDEEVGSWSWPIGKRLTAWHNSNHQVTGAGNIRTLQAGRTGTLVGTRDGWIHWLDPVEGTSRGSWAGPGSEVISAALCEQAKVALIGCETGLVRCLALPSGETQFDFAADDTAVLALAATPDAKTIATASNNRMVTIWRRSATTGRYGLFCRLPASASPAKAINLSADGKFVAVIGRIHGALELWNLSALETELQRLGIE